MEVETMNTQCWIGMPVEQIPTPALVVDVEKLDRNLETMANYLARVKTNLRPHAKTHKTPAIGHKQMRAGAVGSQRMRSPSSVAPLAMTTTYWSVKAKSCTRTGAAVATSATRRTRPFTSIVVIDSCISAWTR